MQTIQWTTELIIIIAAAGIGSAVIGYLIAATLQGRKVVKLSTQLEQSEQTVGVVNSRVSELQDQLKHAELENHQHDLTESKLNEQLSALQVTEQRLSDEITEAKKNSTDLRQQLEDSRQNHHTSEKQHETALAENRSFKQQQEELRERLNNTEVLLKESQEIVSSLKDEMSSEGKKAKSVETSEREAREQLAEVKQALSDLKEIYEQLQQRYQSLTNKHTELNTTLEKREEHFKEQMAQLSETKQSMTKEFENLANKIFEEKGKTFTDTSKSSIDVMLKPFREQIEGFQTRINEVHESSVRDNSSLNAEIKKVLEIGLKMSGEANNLTSALKGDSQQRGAWGEAQLRRTLEMSGLIEEAHYEVQSSFKDAEGKQKQTDYIIKLPDNKHIIIDSKVSLVAYDRAVAADSPEEYQLALAEHIKAVRKHIDDLASKDYTNLVGMRSPSFVLMFMPIEPAYIEALKHNKDLFEYGYKKGIVLVSHTTLIPILRTVSNLWMIEHSNVEAREISEKAGEIYNQVCIVAERLSKLGGTLNTVSNHYNSTVKALAGQQGLHGKVERFSQLSAKVSKTMPQLEPSHVDFETERLSLIVEPINEEAEDPELLEQNHEVETN